MGKIFYNFFEIFAVLIIFWAESFKEFDFARFCAKGFSFYSIDLQLAHKLMNWLIFVLI